jgi:hypothetical protein
MASLHPSHGARIVLEREPGGEARYRVSIYEPDRVHTSVAIVEGGVRFDAWSSEPPVWARIFVERTLLSLAKKHAADGAWPRKLTRWRAERE